MPERNLVSSKRIANPTYWLLIGALVVSTQLGCQKLRNSSLNRDVFSTQPASQNNWAEPLRSQKPTAPIAPVPQPPRFNNDPVEALEELNREAGNPIANVAESADVRIVAVSKESIDTEKKTVKLVAKPPAPTFQSGFANPAEAMPAPTIPRSTFESNAESQRVALASFPQTELRPGYAINQIANSISTQSEDPANCKHFDCDCMKPKLKPELPFAQPVEPPAVSNQAPPSELVSQPLAPILFDKVTREIQIPIQDDQKNTLRSPRELLYENIAVDVNKQEQMLTHESAQIELRTMAPIRSEPIEMPQTAYAEIDSRRCADCGSTVCKGECAHVNNGPRMDLRPIVPSERVVIVATTSEDTMPPYADPPVETEFIYDASVVLSNVQAPTVAPSESDSNSDSVVMGVIEKVDLHELDESQWAEILGAIPVPSNEFATAKPRCPDCLSDQCDDPNCGKDQTYLAANPVEEFLPPMPIQFPPKPETVIEQPVSQDFGGNDFQANNFAPVSHDVESPAVEVSNWQPEDSNFIPAEFNEESVAMLPEPKLVEEVVPKMPVDNLTINRFNNPFPVVDTTIPVAPKTELPPTPQPEPKVIVEVIDNTVPWGVKLVETIDLVRSQLNRETDPRARNGLEVNLRLLEVLQRQMITVEENQSKLSNNERQYWHHQLDAIALMLPSNEAAVSDLDRHNTAYETLDHLRMAVERLESIAKLKVAGGRFCREITGFGKFKPFVSTDFKPGQRTLVYCEVENYLSNSQMQNGQTTFHTRLRGSYVVYDQQGRVVQQAEYPIVEDVARKRRRDFYMYFPIEIGNLAPGAYKLELLVEDLSSNKTASLEPGMPFTIR